ncbi:hypothetical protein PILCRDRAFT_828765 [Piloderma croceum F 1598]|uniref:Uncharacterized protein n=1 Tax=Piloderma croceum (strain F 1598) TaxID=765440 RepID=A0A0C3F1G9_PILCF|nr:hypothetical protein PILCRDRAFT_828765 [Piloderma croceum F 1598]
MVASLRFNFRVCGAGYLVDALLPVIVHLCITCQALLLERLAFSVGATDHRLMTSAACVCLYGFV